MNTLLPVLVAVATFSNCNPSTSNPPSGGNPPSGDPPTVIVWELGTTEVVRETEVSTLIDVRVGSHDAYDRLVFEFDGPVPGYRIEYVDAPTWQCGSGEEVWLDGDAWLEIDLVPAAAHTEEGEPTVDFHTLEADLDVLLVAERTCDFEAVVTWVAGTSSPDGYRVLELSSPSRLVVDFKK